MRLETPPANKVTGASLSALRCSIKHRFHHDVEETASESCLIVAGMIRKGARMVTIESLCLDLWAQKFICQTSNCWVRTNILPGRPL